MISSTALDLPEHRKQAGEACLRVGVFPIGMEQLPPFDESKFEPMPDLELNPKDEFWVAPDKLDSP